MDVLEKRQHAHSGGMGSMSMSSGGKIMPNLFTLQQMYWAVVGAAIGAATLANILNKIIAFQRFHDTSRSPAKPKSLFFRSYATLTAMTREVGDAAIDPLVIVRRLRLHPPRLGPVLLVLANFIVLMVLCFYMFDTTDQWSWEDIGYRTGFVSIAQLPLIFLLAGKNNIIGLLTGSSYDRLNWFHRWISRTLWLTTTIHMCFWFRSWGRYDYIVIKITTDSITQRGLSAWCLLTFIVLTSFSFVRRLSHEVFVVSHLLTMAGFVAAVWYHAPEEVIIWVWIPVGLLSFDRLCRYLFLAYSNLSLFHRNRNNTKKGLLANVATFTPQPGNVTKVSISDPVISWNPGQHVLFSCHSLLPFQSHPFTIASLPSDKKLEFLVRSERGGTRKFFSYASKCAQLNSGASQTRPVTIDGPYGRMRSLRQFNSIVLIAGGMGATFTMPLMRDIAQGWKDDCNLSTTNKSRFKIPTKTLPKRIHFVWVIKEQSYLCWFEDQIRHFVQDFETCHRNNPETFDKQLEISIYVTCDTKLSPAPITLPWSHHNRHRQQQKQREEEEEKEQERPESSSSDSDRPSTRQDADEDEAKDLKVEVAEEDQQIKTGGGGCLPAGGCCCTAKVTNVTKPSAPCTCSTPITTDATSVPPTESKEYSSPPLEKQELDNEPEKECTITRFLSGRPDVREIIRATLERAEGETAVAVCGPRGLNADARRSVVALSDERAVHKGTGAQGIYLHVEQFEF